MREILFRGQTRRNGEKVWMNGEKVPGRWVYGGVLQGVGAHSIIYGGENADKPGEGLDKWPVYTDTLGQYTGLQDKNGKRIFEGDIVEGHCHSAWRHDLRRCEVAYGRDGFEARHHVNCGDEWRYFTYRVLFSKDVVVIGNIHDNPELLGGVEA